MNNVFLPLGYVTSQLLFNKDDYWIGLHQFESGNFAWADNSLVTFTNWAMGEPNGGEEVSVKSLHNAE